MTHKEIAKAFLQMASNQDYQAAYDKFIAPNFIHHNQYFKGDRQSLMAAMQESSKVSPNKSIEVKKIYEDGNTVITHSLVNRKNPGDLPIAVIHIFRFENGKVVEMWDIGQQLMKDSPNENGPF